MNSPRERNSETDCGSSENLIEAERSESDLQFNDVQYCLPHFAYSSAVRPMLNKVGFNVEKNPKNGLAEYTFSVKWTDCSREALDSYNKLKKPIKLAKTSDTSVKDQPDVMCDGPCGKTYKEDQIYQFGICDHNICANCYATGTNVPLFDSTPGCCNKDCYLRDLYNLNPTTENRRGYGIATSIARTVGSAASCTSLEAAELLLVRVMSFTKMNGRINRKKFEREMSSRLRMKDLYKLLKDTIPDLEESQIFFTRASAFRRDDLIPLVSKSFDRRTLYDMAAGKDTMNFVVIAPGVTVFK